MTAARSVATVALAISALIAMPAWAADRPAAQPRPQAVAAAPAASGETRDIVQTAFFQALAAPVAAEAGGAR